MGSLPPLDHWKPIRSSDKGSIWSEVPGTLSQGQSQFPLHKGWESLLCSEEAWLPLLSTLTPPSPLYIPSFNPPGRSQSYYLQSHIYLPPAPCAFIFNIMIHKSEMTQIKVRKLRKAGDRKEERGTFVPQDLRKEWTFVNSLFCFRQCSDASFYQALTITM